MGTAMDPVLWEKEAQTAYAQRAYEIAAQAFEKAAGAYDEGGEVLKAAEMRNNASVAWLQAERPEAALRCVEGTPELFAQAGDKRRQALALGNQAAALEALGQAEIALEIYRRAADGLKAVGEMENYARVMRRISALQVQTGQQFAALFSMQAALEYQPKLSPRERMLKSLIGTVQRLMGIK
ncbi:hypothetical protein [uncultured Thermanaerothrix sp.]|uniref:hypothetical protein n=1 Tax=uncultured Thermanaerothrix sp. TaxID=1195149 RepID=UPI00260B2772|nr:hypothetical protein [uncultured Thermanaerothrix sp.]